MKYITIYAKDISIIPEFFQELENRTRSKVIKHYIRNTIIPFYLHKDKSNTVENPKVTNALEANKLKSIVSEILGKKNKVSEHKFIREGNLLSYKMFPTNIFEGLQNTFVKPVVIELKKYLKENSIKLNDTYIKKINKTLQKDKFLRRFVKEEYNEPELLTLFIIYKFKTLSVTDLDQDNVLFYTFTEDEKEHLKHTIDYLNSKLDVENTPNWKEEKAQKEKELKEHLSNLSFTELEQEVENYNFTDENIQNKTLEQEIKDNDIKLVHTYPNKYSWVSIISEEGLDREGSNMNHCVGGDNYWRAVKNNETVIYSLRNKYNKPHITIEVTNYTIIQIQGYGNSDVSEKYHDMLLDGLQNHIVFKEADEYSLNKNGIIQQDSNLYSIYNLPDNITCNLLKLKSTNKHFEIKNVKCKNLEIGNCPNIHITGNITVYYIISIEDEEAFFSIQKFLDKIINKTEGPIQIWNYYVDVTTEEELECLRNCIPVKIKKILDKYNIRTNLKIKSLSIKHVHNDLNLIHNTKLKELPEGLVIDGNLDLNNSKNIVLPKNLHVKGYAYLRRTENIVIQSGTFIERILDITYSSRVKLPKDLHVGGNLYLQGTKIKELPEGLYVVGSLNLSGTEITKLPKELHVGSSLYLQWTKITKLSEKLHVGGDLNLQYTPITELPEKLHVGGALNLRGTSITKLPEKLHVGGNLDLAGTNITKLPEKLHVGRSLDLRGTSITKLPEKLHVGGEIIRGYHEIR